MLALKKNGQVRISETIAVIFIFFVIILFGVIFYYKYQQVSLKEQQEEMLGARAMDTTLKTLFLPELQCSRGEAEPEDNCIDMMKLPGAATVFKENENYYFNIFSYANVSIHQLYPDAEEKVWILYDKEKVKLSEEGILEKDWQRKEATYFVLTLRDQRKANGEFTYGFGYLKVEVYS